MTQRTLLSLLVFVLAMGALPAAAQDAEARAGAVEAEAEADAEVSGDVDGDANGREVEVAADREVAALAAPEVESELDGPTIPEREVPDYDGRDDAPPTPGEVALWVPRIALFPLYFIAEYILRRPLGWLIGGAEEKEIPERVVQFFTFGPEGNVALAPTFSFDFGFRPAVGLYFRYNEFLREDFALRAGASFGGLSWITGQVAFRVEPANGDRMFQVSLEAMKRPDGLFFGLGSNVDQDNRSRYDFVGYQGLISLSQRLVRQSTISVSVGLVDRKFGDDIIEGSYSIEERVAAGQVELPPGYADGYTIVTHGAQLTLDNRRARPAPGSGVRFAAAYDLAFDLQNGPASRLWVTWTTSLGFYLDLSQHQHIVSLTATLTAAEALSGEVPFFEQPNLSGNGPMRGFVGRFLSGDSAASILLRYDWPVWIWLDGTIQVAVGNVYDGRFAGLSAGNTRLSAGIGLAAVDQRDHFFEFLIGFGTETFDQGAQIQSFRLLVGGTQQF